MSIPKEHNSAEYNPEAAFTKLDSFVRSKLISDPEYTYSQKLDIFRWLDNRDVAVLTLFEMRPEYFIDSKPADLRGLGQEFCKTTNSLDESEFGEARRREFGFYLMGLADGLELAKTGRVRKFE